MRNIDAPVGCADRIARIHGALGGGPKLRRVLWRHVAQSTVVGGAAVWPFSKGLGWSTCPGLFIAFGLEGVGIYMLYLWGQDPIWFVLLSGAVFFAWGEIYSLFPSTCKDTFGPQFATTNAGLLYTAKGTAALLVPLANYVQQSSGQWASVFLIAAGANILASALALVVLKPWRKSVIKNA